VPEDDHRHCKVCGTVCAPGEDTCSDACAAKRAQVAQTRRLYTYLMYAVILVLVIAFVVRF
jgi:predicted nucleic acid-binding Zn ribbon protein